MRRRGAQQPSSRATIPADTFVDGIQKIDAYEDFVRVFWAATKRAAGSEYSDPMVAMVIPLSRVPNVIADLINALQAMPSKVSH